MAIHPQQVLGMGRLSEQYGSDECSRAQHLLFSACRAMHTGERYS